MQEKKNELLRLIGKGYNQMDFTGLKDILAEDAVYESQMIFRPLEGRSNIIKYMQGKMETIRRTISGGDEAVRLVAELGHIPGMAQSMTRVGDMDPDNEPCLIVSQGSPPERRQLLLLKLDEDGGRIKRMDACMIVPPPEVAVGTGEFPGLAS